LRTKVARESFTTVMIGVLTGLGVAVSVLLGSYYTARAVVSGDPAGTFVRFVGSIALGSYYLALHRWSRGRRSFIR
jgi:hypothetical protein